MSPERTIYCPNGCDPELLERGAYGGFKATVGGFKYPLNEYNCGACGWSAIWTLEQGLVVENNPAMRSFEETAAWYEEDPDNRLPF